MKILLIAPVWGHLGGLERYVADCVQEFTRLGHDCSVIYGRRSQVPVEDDIESMLHRAHHLPNLSRFETAEDAIEAKHLEAILATERPDVIFMTGVRNFLLLSSLNTFGRLVPMSHDCSLVCMRMTSTTYVCRSICTHKLGLRCLLHGCSVRKDPDDPAQRLIFNNLSHHQMLLSAYRTMGLHLVNSEYMKARLVQHGFRPEQLIVVGCFTNMTAQPFEPARPSVPLISFVGRINRYKGADYLIRALSHISTPFRCSIVGDGERLSFCKELANKLGLSGRVDFLGRRSTAEIAEHLREISVAVVPSIFPEPFGIVGLEAMISSKPVVAFDVGGIPDWLKDGKTGYLVPPKDTKRLAQRIESLLLDPRRADEMGAEGYRVVTREFSKERHFERLLSVFESVGRTSGRKTVYASSRATGAQRLTIEM